MNQKTQVRTQIEFRGELLTVRRTQYADGNPALVLEDSMGLPYMKCSVNIPERPLPAGEIYIKNWSENSGILETLEKAGIIEDTQTAVVTGHTFANICKLLI